jgi:hypothetical protein
MEAEMTDTIIDGIVLSAYNGSTEPDRIERLNRVCDRLGNHYPDVAFRIGALHDHKGELTVNWAIPPWLADKQIVEAAWKVECEYQVEHRYRDEVIGRAG